MAQDQSPRMDTEGADRDRRVLKGLLTLVTFFDFQQQLISESDHEGSGSRVFINIHVGSLILF